MKRRAALPNNEGEYSATADSYSSAAQNRDDRTVILKEQLKAMYGVGLAHFAENV
jgi:hypothetical protein